MNTLSAHSVQINNVAMAIVPGSFKMNGAKKREQLSGDEKCLMEVNAGGRKA